MIEPILVNNVVPVFLILLALITGRLAEKKHFRSIERRERELSGMLVSDIKTFPDGPDPRKGGDMVIGEVVIATDYLKSLLAGLRKIMGGELRSYLSLMTRARREAVLRMMEEARKKGYNAVCNMRIEFADIGGIVAKGTITVAVIASGTAYSIDKGTL